MRVCESPKDYRGFVYTLAKPRPSSILASGAGPMRDSIEKLVLTAPLCMLVSIKKRRCLDS